MNPKHVEILCTDLSLHKRQVQNTMILIDEGATVPFISRYRKEMTDSMNEVQVEAVKVNYEKLKAVDARRTAIIQSIEEQGKMTDELRAKLEETYEMNVLEDLYLPYKPKRKTRATIAREKGLEPLANLIADQRTGSLREKAKEFLNEQVLTIEDALQGARDIIAEEISENITVRNSVRNIFSQEAIIGTSVVEEKKDEGLKYKDYFEFKEPLNKCVSHRLLAMMRAMEEGVLRVSIATDESKTIENIENLVIKPEACLEAKEQYKLATADSYKRLISPSIETEFFNSSKEKADEEAIKVFAVNLRQLLLSPPLGKKRVLALDPGFRTGCKVACLDAYGNLIHHDAIFPNPPQSEVAKASMKLISLISEYKIDVIAVGNGTAGRETEAFIKQYIKPYTKIEVFTVDEDGASIYSASAVAREEFPEQDITVRGAVSIGRRLIDPLSELVKIDPKSIGVGQYQHDVSQTKLKESLDSIVVSCVNSVGVNLNTASKYLLRYVSGIGENLAQNIVEFRKNNGNFYSREELRKVSRLGEKTFEQCAGFLRVPESKNPLDNSAVHPESYEIVEKMARDLNVSVSELMKNKELQKKIDLNKYVTKNVGLPTLQDILKELEKPGLDPRNQIENFEFSDSIRVFEDLHEGMVLQGIVTNITNFGVFVDIGIKENGLIHISHLSNKYVANPADFVKLQQKVKVKIIGIEKDRRRIQLSMKEV